MPRPEPGSEDSVNPRGLYCPRSGRSSAVERRVPNAKVEGSIPFARFDCRRCHLMTSAVFHWHAQSTSGCRRSALRWKSWGDSPNDDTNWGRRPFPVPGLRLRHGRDTDRECCLQNLTVVVTEGCSKRARSSLDLNLPFGRDSRREDRPFEFGSGSRGALSAPQRRHWISVLTHSPQLP